MKKYFTVFKLSIARELEYRFNFFLGRLRNIIILLLLFYVWQALTYKTGSFAGYTQQELITYIFGVNILRSIIFGAQSKQLASEINDGWFSKYLVQPINVFLYQFFRELGERSIHLFSAIIEVIIFVLILDVDIFIQTNFLILISLFFSILFATILYYLLSYLISMLAFWSRETMSPRFLFEWFLEFASGVYFPLDILSKLFFVSLTFLPFIYLIFFPISIYLGKYGTTQMIAGIFTQLIWIISIGMLNIYVWNKGLKKYSSASS
ncbi:ABC-2 family transporter protein [Candidatus Parcubacteria bacterium]|nr:ABC-2 family transporter protein [Candidatus Parcubacteria bacterium]